MKKIKASAIAFDYGNTLLLDPFKDVVSKKSTEITNLLRRNGYKVEEREVVSRWVESNKEINGPHYSHFSQEEPIIQDFLKRIGVKPEDSKILAPEILLEYRHGLKEFILRNNYTEIKETLEYLRNKGKKLFVWSNDREYGVKSVMKWMNLNSYFDKIISSEEIGVEKPDIKFFRKCLDICGIEAKDTVYIGDDPGRDIAPANRTGLKTLLYKTREQEAAPWRKYETPAKPDAIIEKISDLREIIL